MTVRLRPLLPALAGAVVIGLGGAAWIGSRLWQQPEAGRDAGALLDLILASPSATVPVSEEPRREAPKPPQRPAWQSPLQGQCPPLDPDLQLRLEELRRRLARSVRPLQIHPSNYGSRFSQDAFGTPVDPTPRVIVLHETVYGLGSAINTFTTPHPRDDDQVSYHSLVGLNGTLVRAVDPRQRAFGAGNSSFNGEWVVTNPSIGGSINNFALHLSLETPLDGENEASQHSGYSPAQYDVMAVELSHWLQTFGIPPEHITTHRHVDNGGERADPRSFDWQALASRLRALGHLCGV